MIIFPIIPIWIMILICAILVFFRSKERKRLIRQIIIIILLFLINLRIMIPSSNVKSKENNLDVLFVIDNTISMLAEDYNGGSTRLSAVKKDCKLIVDKLNGANFSIITFNNTSRIVIPYTKDANVTIEAIQMMQPVNELYANGTTLNIPLEDIKSMLEVSKNKENRKRIVFFISDGEITKENEVLKSFNVLQKSIDNGAILGYGTKSGGKMKVTNEYTEEENYVQDITKDRYTEAVSTINENNLKSLAKDMKVDYINMNKQSNIDYKIKQIEKELLESEKDKKEETNTDINIIFVFPLLILLIFEIINYRRSL